APTDKTDLHSSLASPYIVSTKNQNKIQNANAATYLFCNFIPANTMRTNPTNASISVDAIHGRKLSANPSMSKCLKHIVLRVFGSSYEQDKGYPLSAGLTGFLFAG